MEDCCTTEQLYKYYWIKPTGKELYSVVLTDAENYAHCHVYKSVKRVKHIIHIYTHAVGSNGRRFESSRSRLEDSDSISPCQRKISRVKCRSPADTVHSFHHNLYWSFQPSIFELKQWSLTVWTGKTEVAKLIRVSWSLRKMQLRWTVLRKRVA